MRIIVKGSARKIEYSFQKDVIVKSLFDSQGYKIEEIEYPDTDDNKMIISDLCSQHKNVYCVLNDGEMVDYRQALIF